jgi:putative transposase
VPLSAKEMGLMRQIDEIHLAYPFYGSRKIRNALWARGYDVGRDRVRRLMRRMGIEALYVKPRLSLAHPGHVKYPYLLRGLEITRANHVWATDICYIPMAKGFCYLVAIMDWASRMVLAWRLSNTLDSSFCVDALEEAIASSPRRRLQTLSVRVAFQSAWTARAVGWTTSLSNDSGKASSMRIFI